MADHETASDLTAVLEDTVFRGGPTHVGPLEHVFLVERYARLYFPDTYHGELFDRDELTAIVTDSPIRNTRSPVRRVGTRPLLNREYRPVH
ncbi:hypothetical protein BRC85_04220 [Halobacteriales archaeon QS_1_69_70]|nr:MAG: hypothetical protein BRC85_04220 [Halobacteriales archaeon QS_1_69_70]